MNTLDFILKKYNVRLQPDTEHRINCQQMPLDLPIGREQLAELFAELGFKSGAEIGVEQGEYSEVLAKANPHAVIFLVDAWRAYPGYRDHVTQSKLDGFYSTTVDRMKAHPGIQIIREWSSEATQQFGPNLLDFVYIDANHSFDYVMLDIIEWSKRVKPGGIISGHDFFVGKGNQQHQVPIAVRAYTEAHHISPWFVCRSDHSPSWFFVK